MRLGVDHDQIYASCAIDPWFLSRIQEIVDTEARVKAHGLPTTASTMRALKAMGFGDARLGKLSGLGEAEVRRQRHALDVRPVYKRIDTCAAEFESPTAYMYSTYESGLMLSADGRPAAPTCEAQSSEREKVIILGGGPNRIGPLFRTDGEGGAAGDLQGLLQGLHGAARNPDGRLRRL